MKKTFRELLKANGGEPLEFRVNIPDRGVLKLDDEGERYVTDSGGYLEASCWTDDEEYLDHEASFDIDASWADHGLGRYANLRGELERKIDELADLIGERIGGEWYYDAADEAFYQS
jgi:hypothetical protein